MREGKAGMKANNKKVVGNNINKTTTEISQRRIITVHQTIGVPTPHELIEKSTNKLFRHLQM